MPNAHSDYPPVAQVAQDSPPPFAAPTPVRAGSPKMSSESIKDAAGKAAQIVGDKGIDYLVNNAGIVSCQLCSPFHIQEVL